MTKAEELKKELTDLFPLSKEEFISYICDQIKWKGCAEFYCHPYVKETKNNSIRRRDEQAAIRIAESEGFKYHYSTNSWGARIIVFTL